MGAHGDEVDRLPEEGHVQPADCLHGVAVHEGPGNKLAGDSGDVCETLDDTGLVVDEHHGDFHDATGVAREPLLEPSHVEKAVRVDHKLLTTGGAHRLEHSRVLDGAATDERAVDASLAGSRGDPGHGEVVGFGPTAREHHLAGVAAEHLGQRVPGVVDGPARRSGHGMPSGGVAEGGRHPWQHRLENLRAHRRRGGVVEVGHPAGGARHLR